MHTRKLVRWPNKGQVQHTGTVLESAGASSTRGVPGQAMSTYQARRRRVEVGKVQASPHPLSAPQLSGEWYAAAIASNNSALIRPGGHFRVFIEDICVMDGNLHGKILVPWVQGAAVKLRDRAGPREGTEALCSKGRASGI